MSEAKHFNVVICTPGHSVMNSYLLSLIKTVQALGERGVTWAWSGQYASMVSDAREMTANGGPHQNVKDTRPFQGNITYDKLFWIDSDIAWEPEEFLKLYDSDKDIITGAYLLGSGEVMAHPKLLGKPYVIEEVLKMTELVKVASCGFGFIAVKQGVFESLKRPWFQSTEGVWTFPDTGEKFIFNIMGEDIAWCKKVTDLGYEIWFDPTVRVLHHKTMKLTWEGPKP